MWAILHLNENQPLDEYSKTKLYSSVALPIQGEMAQHKKLLECEIVCSSSRHAAFDM